MMEECKLMMKRIYKLAISIQKIFLPSTSYFLLLEFSTWLHHQLTHPWLCLIYSQTHCSLKKTPRKCFLIIQTGSGLKFHSRNITWTSSSQQSYFCLYLYLCDSDCLLSPSHWATGIDLSDPELVPTTFGLILTVKKIKKSFKTFRRKYTNTE